MFQIDAEDPVKIVRDEIDESKLMETEMGILSHPAAAVAKVHVVHSRGWKAVCECRWLAMHSKYFRRLLSRFPIPSTITVPEHIPIEGFADAMQFINEGAIDVVPSKLAALLIAAFQLEIPQLQRRLEHYLRVLSNINVSHFLFCWDICYAAGASVQLRDEMMRRASEKFDTLYGCPDWPRVSEHLIRQLFVRQDLKVKTATSIYEAALTWIIGNPSIEPAAADRIMSAVPFYRMSTVDRLQCLERAKRMQMTSLVRPRIMLADWHVSCHDAGQDNASDMRPIKPDEVNGEGRLHQRYQNGSKDKTTRPPSADQTRQSFATIPETPSPSTPPWLSRSMQKQTPAETQTSENCPTEPASQEQNSKTMPGLGNPSRFTSDSRKIVHQETPVSLHGPFVDLGHPIRFSMITSIKKTRVTYKTPVAEEGPFLDVGKSIRFSSQTTIKKVREETGRERVPHVRGAPICQSAGDSDQEQSKSMLDPSGPICYCSPLIKKDQIAIDHTPVGVEGPFIDVGMPIRFSSKTLIKKVRDVLSSVGDSFRDSGLSVSESAPKSTEQRSPATVSGTESSKAPDYGISQPLRFNPAKWTEGQKAPGEPTLPSTTSTENVMVSTTASATSKESSETEESESDNSVEMGKPLRFSTKALIKKMLENEVPSPEEEVEKSDQSSTSSLSLAL